jgi:UDP-N-acetylmuramate: L-alanyl-gamma-D-glutamyl-meso-diaminopimelate ligase
MMANLEKGKFTINDFVKQMETINRLGSFGSILKMIPGMGGALRQMGDLSPAENEMKKMKVIINSMTKKEREDVAALPYVEHKSEVIDGETYLVDGKNKYPIAIFGSHNLSNISAAKAVCKEMGINAPEFYSAIADFKGAGGRMQVLAKKPGTIIFKDFAHAPSKVMATTKAVKKQFPERKLIACIELHTFSSLNKKFIGTYAGSLKAADVAAVYYNPKVVEHKKLEPISPEELIEAFKNPAIKVFTDSAKLMEFIKQQPLIQANLLFMSSGNFDGFDLQAIANELI